MRRAGWIVAAALLLLLLLAGGGLLLSPSSAPSVATDAVATDGTADSASAKERPLRRPAAADAAADTDVSPYPPGHPVNLDAVGGAENVTPGGEELRIVLSK